MGSPRWSPDGRSLAFDGKPGAHFQIWLLNVSKPSAPHRLNQTSYEDLIPTWSGDGEWIYFLSDRGGRNELWKQNLKTSQTLKVTSETALDATESFDGNQLYYERPEGSIWRLAKAAGTAEPINKLTGYHMARNLTLAHEGLYFTTRPIAPSPLGILLFGGASVAELGRIDGDLVEGTPSWAVSPDGHWLLYAQQEPRRSNIMVARQVSLNQTVVSFALTPLENPIPDAGIDTLPPTVRYKINDLIASRMATTHIAGLSLAVVQHGKSVYVKGFGVADVDTQSRVTARTRFEIGSETKSFTALGVMRLYDEPRLIQQPGIKRLDLDKPIATYVSDTSTFSLPSKWGGITVRELLAMAGGTEDLGSNTLTWEEIINQVGLSDLLFYPGAGDCCSNPGYMLLGELIQQITQMDYRTFMDRFVFRPIGMSNSTIHLESTPSHVATGYTCDAKTWETPAYRPGSSSFSSGAMLTSAADLASFLVTASNRRFLKPLPTI